ncbi:hypothetical protein FGB62_97g112 [Gracilaria domingensis]|nr:hypothetical protein FGB62_97g112 [Gracilaria domingensis]
MYHGLDWFYASNYKQPVTEEFIRLDLHRDAKIYLMVGMVNNSNFPIVTLEGWESEGWVKRVGRLESKFTVGVHQNYSRWLPKVAYIFSRRATGYAVLPSQQWVDRKISGSRKIGSWYVMIAEADGSASKPPTPPYRLTAPIIPNRKCPDELHADWTTPETDSLDPDVSARHWPTWHPQWDPCYWCAYDHEHGSSPVAAMGYAPKFGYTAWKNFREAESHEGFKCTVFRSGQYYICFCMHAQTSSLRRVNVRYHTIIFAVADSETKELVAEIRHKGFFGYTGTKKRGGGFMGINKEEEQMRMALKQSSGISNKRSVNTINKYSLNPMYSYNRELMRGNYEEWTTSTICSDAGGHGMLHIDTRNPITGIVSGKKLGEVVLLGNEAKGTFLRNDGSSRLVKLRAFRFGEKYCSFGSQNVSGTGSSNGVFYTDASGRKLKSGPGKYHIRQFVKPGLNFEVSGLYEMVDPWGSELVLGVSPGITSIGFGLDPGVN